MVATAPIPQFTQIGGSPVSTPRWFADSGYALRFKTRINPLICGEEAFSAIARALKGATKTINIAIWGFDPGLVMIRNGNGTYAEADILYNILLGRANAGVKVNVVVWEGALRRATGFNIAHSDNLMKFFAEAETNNNIECVLTPHNSAFNRTGSFHQKMVIVDVEDPEKATAFVMGHNLMPEYWTSTTLPAYSSRRDFALKLTTHSTTGPGPTSTRQFWSRTAMKKDPYFDISSQIWGAGVLDVYHVFSTIWRKNDRQEVPDVTSLNGKLQKYIMASSAGGSTISQVAVTWPPGGIKAIREQYVNAFRATDRYAIMVNQYFREEDVTPLLINSFKERGVPDEKEIALILVTSDWENSPLQEGHDTAVLRQFSDAKIPISSAKLVTQNAQQRRDIYVHAKLLTVDNVFMTLGSANYNNRGMVSDPELNIGAVDSALTTSLRRRVMNIIIDDPMNDLHTSPKEGYERWLTLLAENDQDYAANRNLRHGVAVTYTPTGWRGLLPTKFAEAPVTETDTAYG